MGDFDWNLEFAWSNLPSEGVYQNGRNREIDPIPTPIVPLGVFVVHQSFFWKIGSFDLGMEIWGAENIEISFRKVTRYESYDISELFERILVQKIEHGCAEASWHLFLAHMLAISIEPNILILLASTILITKGTDYLSNLSVFLTVISKFLGHY